jgi:hypothetical protein
MNDIMRAKHGYKFISKIPKESAGMLHEDWIEYANKNEPEKNDRAKNIRYNIEIGGITLSLANGSITIDTDLNEKEIQKNMKPLLGKDAFKTFCDNLRCTNIGAHFTKGHGTARFILIVKEPGRFPLSLTCRRGNNYDDFHFHVRIPCDAGTIKDYSKELYPNTATISPKRNYLSDTRVYDTIIEINKENESVTAKQLAKKLGLNQSTAYRRLEKLRRIGKIYKNGSNPAIYEIN